MKKTTWGGVLGAASAIALATLVGMPSLASNQEETAQYLHASWSYNYADIAEISRASDVIALIRVDGVEQTYEEQGLPFTKFGVTVVRPVQGVVEGEAFTILMTGATRPDAIIEVADDPLMRVGEEFLVFCQENPDRTYRILGGPQGRLVHTNGTLSSLDVVNSRVRAENPYSNISIDHANLEDIITAAQAARQG